MLKHKPFALDFRTKELRIKTKKVSGKKCKKMFKNRDAKGRKAKGIVKKRHSHKKAPNRPCKASNETDLALVVRCDDAHVKRQPSNLLTDFFTVSATGNVFIDDSSPMDHGYFTDAYFDSYDSTYADESKSSCPDHTSEPSYFLRSRAAPKLGQAKKKLSACNDDMKEAEKIDER